MLGVRSIRFYRIPYSGDCQFDLKLLNPAVLHPIVSDHRWFSFLMPIFEFMIQITINSGYQEPSCIFCEASHKICIIQLFSPISVSQYILNKSGTMAGEETKAKRYGDRFEDSQGNQAFITNQVRQERRTWRRYFFCCRQYFETDNVLTQNIL